MPVITKILVANRGEIALRIMRTCKEMQIATVAVYSEADAKSPHVKFADQAVCIGPPPSNQSYLVGEKIIQAAKDSGAQAIHPGYGFLSENPRFARMVKEAGLIFIGPSPEAMEVMGSKLGAKDAVRKYDIPLVPGSDGAIATVEEALKIGKSIGFPILIKASAGGGGKGMRIVEQESEFEENLKRAISEAESAFGDGSVFLEKYLGNSKHIEVQVLGDSHGNYVHLFERECSVQRRHQKVVEEAPSPVVSAELRKQMGQHAANVAKACAYEGAGTVEFIFQDGEYYFLEMNTRLQVEHPVTEMITGIDLVREQIQIAMGQPISFKQEELTLTGHAIEIRVYAEDPANGFLPDIGRLRVYQPPHGPGVRVDDGFEEGMDIPIYYDPMLSKLICYGKDRTEAIARMTQAIDEYYIIGAETTLGFCRYVINHEEFISGRFNTQFVKNFFEPKDLETPLNAAEEKATAFFVHNWLKEHKPYKQSVDQHSNWRNNRTL